VQGHLPTVQASWVKLPDRAPSVHLRLSDLQVLPQETVELWKKVLLSPSFMGAPSGPKQGHLPTVHVTWVKLPDRKPSVHVRLSLEHVSPQATEARE
jgi:hypothetical protein